MPWWAIILTTVGSSIAISSITIAATKLVKIQRDVAKILVWFDPNNDMVKVALGKPLPEVVVDLQKWRLSQNGRS